MFTRSSTAEPTTLEPISSNGSANGGFNIQPAPRRASVSDPDTKSVIGNDLKIIGQGLKIIARARCRSTARSKATSAAAR
jgi:hypothetical protein